MSNRDFENGKQDRIVIPLRTLAPAFDSATANRARPLLKWVFNICLLFPVNAFLSAALFLLLFQSFEKSVFPASARSCRSQPSFGCHLAVVPFFLGFLFSSSSSSSLVSSSLLVLSSLSSLKKLSYLFVHAIVDDRR